MLGCRWRRIGLMGGGIWSWVDILDKSVRFESEERR